jgi:hypothetical protein
MAGFDHVILNHAAKSVLWPERLNYALPEKPNQLIKAVFHPGRHGGGVAQVRNPASDLEAFFSGGQEFI